MKIFKVLLDCTVLILIAALLFLFTVKENEELIPDSDYVIKVKSWNHEYNKDTIFKTIEEYAKSQNLSIYKVSLNYQKPNVDKDIYVFNSKNDVTIKPLSTQKEHQYLSYNELLKRDVKGDYLVTESSNFDQNLLKIELAHKGVDIEIFKVNKFMIALGTIADMNLIIPLIAIAMIYLLYYLYDKNMRFKEYAIKTLHGYSLKHLWFEHMPRYIRYWSFLFIGQLIISVVVLWVTYYDGYLWLFIERLFILFICFIVFLMLLQAWTYILLLNMNIGSMIKGKQHFKTIRLINTFAKCILLALLAIIIIQNFNTISEVKKINNTEKYWKLLDEYYTVDLAPVKGTEKEEKERDKKLHQFVVESEKQGNAILAKSNQIYHPKLDDFSPYNGNVLFVNTQFWKLYNQAFPTGLSFKSSPSIIEVKVPHSLSHLSKDISQEYNEWFNTVKASNSAKKSIVMNTYDKDVNIFSFGQRSLGESQFIKSPTIVYVGAEDLWDDFYASTVSQGGYLFKDYNQIIKNIKKYNLDNDIGGVTNYKEGIEQELRENQLKIMILTFSEILLVVVSLAIILFDIKYYFEQHKKFLVLKKLFGFNLLHANYKYLLISNGLVAVIGVATAQFLSNPAGLWIFLIIIVIQLVLQSWYIHYLEKYYAKVIREL